MNFSALRRLSSVPQRLAVLRKLQDAADILARDAEKELLEKELAVRADLHRRAQQIRERRAAIIAGGDLTDEEKKLEPLNLDSVPPSLSKSLDGYWCAVLKRILGDAGTDLRDDGLDDFDMPAWLTAADEAVLQHLLDIQLSIEVDQHDASSDTLQLTFVFAPNEFLEPGSETLTLEFKRKMREIQRSTGCSIKWRDGKDPTVARIEPKGGTGDVASVELQPSFFHLFTAADFATGVDESRLSEDEFEVGASVDLACSSFPYPDATCALPRQEGYLSSCRRGE